MPDRPSLPLSERRRDLESEGWTNGGGGLWVKIVPDRSLRERLWDVLFPARP